MTDAEIDTTDIPPVDKEFFDTAELWLPGGRSSVLLTVDEDVLDWFEEQGPNYPQIMNTALREYADAHR